MDDVTCPQCRNISLKDSPLHALDCNRLKPARGRRHNKVSALLHRLLRGCFPSDVVTKEGSLRNGQSTYKADVLWRHEGCIHILDVAIVDPTALTHQQASSMTIPDAAALIREQAKKDRFALTQVQHTTFTPFVIEASGRLGGAARRWMETTFNITRKHKAKMFLQQMSATLVKWNAWMIQAARVYHTPQPSRGA